MAYSARPRTATVAPHGSASARFSKSFTRGHIRALFAVNVIVVVVGVVIVVGVVVIFIILPQKYWKNRKDELSSALFL